MKRMICVLLAALMLLSAGCGNGGTSQNGGSSGTPKTADGNEYDNSVVFVDGKLKGTDFNWQYFTAKIESGRGGEVTVAVTEKGKTRVFAISYDGSSFTLVEEETVCFYDHLVSFESGGRSFAVLTDDGELTADKLFGGKAPSSVDPGDSFADGIVIFAN